VSRAALIIFQKNAVLGKVKTRLAASIGDEQALEVYRWLTSYTHQMAQDLKVDKFLFYSDFVPANSDESLAGYREEVQSGANLGERMRNAFAQLFGKGYKNVVIIGTDCPELEPVDLNEAFEALEQTDMVFGPAKDGGYYLLGMSSFIPEVFNDIPWSTNKVLELTLNKADSLKLKYEFLKTLSDIDTIKDLEEFNTRNKITNG
jgi:uncharacterized protein